VSEPIDNLTIRPYDAGDADALAAILFAAFDAGELKGSTRADVAFWHSRLPSDPSGTLVATIDGRPVGLVTPQHEQLVVDRAVRRRGIGRRLVAAAEELVRSRGAGPLFLARPHENDGAHAFLRQLSYGYHHSLWRMRLRDDAVMPPPDFPPDVVRHPYRNQDLEPFVELVNSAFRDHPTPWSMTVEQVRYIHDRPDFNPDNLCLLAPAGDPNALIAFCRVVPENDEIKTSAHISILGVRRGWRGQGLGRELLRWGLQRGRDLDAAEMSLAVVGENERALRLYERNGFVRDKEWPRYARQV
jgi:mycothiol synthase